MLVEGRGPPGQLLSMSLCSQVEDFKCKHSTAKMLMSQSYSSSGGWWRVHEYQTTTPPFDLANYSYLDPICFLYTAWCLGALPDCLYFPILTCRGRNSASKQYLYHGRDGSGRNCSLSVGSGSGTQLTRMLLHPWLLKQSLFWHQMLEPKLSVDDQNWQQIRPTGLTGRSRRSDRSLTM